MDIKHIEELRKTNQKFLKLDDTLRDIDLKLKEFTKRIASLNLDKEEELSKDEKKEIERLCKLNKACIIEYQNYK